MKKSILLFAIILSAFQAKCQDEEILLSLKNHEQEKIHDSIYYELFKITYTSDEHKARHYISLVLKLSRKYNHSKLEVKAYRGLGILFDISNKTDSASIYFHRALLISSSYNYTNQSIDIYNDLGILHERNDVYDSALHYFKSAYNLAVQNRLYKSQAIASYNIGHVYSYLENYQEALIYFKQAIEIKTAYNISDGLNLNLINLARVLNEQGQYQDAIQQLKKVEINCTNGCDENTLTGLYYELGYSNLKKGYKNESYNFFIKALGLARENNSQKWLANTLYNLSFFSIDSGVYKEAEKYLLESEKIARQISHKRLLRDVYAQLSTLYSKIEKTGEGLNYKNKYVDLKDEIFNHSVANNIKALELTEQRKQSDSVILGKEIELLKSNLLTILVTVIFTLILVVIYLIYNSKAKNHKHKKELEIVDAIELERQRIGSDMHDEIASQVASLYIDLELVNKERSFLSSQANQVLTNMSPKIESTIESLRGIIFGMLPPELVNKNLVEAVYELCQKHDGVNGTEVIFQTFGEPSTLTEEKRLYVYRIIQELLNNCIKHSQGLSIFISLIWSIAELKLVICDDGIGLPKASKNHDRYGLKIIFLRAKKIGATASFNTPEKGLEFILILPLK